MSVIVVLAPDLDAELKTVWVVFVVLWCGAMVRNLWFRWALAIELTDAHMLRWQTRRRSGEVPVRDVMEIAMCRYQHGEVIFRTDNDIVCVTHAFRDIRPFIEACQAANPSMAIHLPRRWRPRSPVPAG